MNLVYKSISIFENEEIMIILQNTIKNLITEKYAIMVYGTTPDVSRLKFNRVISFGGLQVILFFRNLIYDSEILSRTKLHSSSQDYVHFPARKYIRPRAEIEKKEKRKKKKK